MKSNESLFAWTVAMHNIVNVETGKPVVSVETAYSIYMEREKKSNIVPICVGIVSVVIAALVLNLFASRIFGSRVKQS